MSKHLVQIGAPTRTEFGYSRTVCDCEICTRNCEYIPGFLIPSDLERLMLSDRPDEWASKNLLASPGALAVQRGVMYRIPTIVPATKPDGSCIHLDADRHCGIHADAPFGCAFFDCNLDNPRYDLSAMGLGAVAKAWQYTSLYAVTWAFLDSNGFKQHSPDVLRERMKERR